MKRRLAIVAIFLAVIAGSAWTYLRLRGETPTARAEQLLASGKVWDALLVLRTLTRDDQKDSYPFMLLGRAHERVGDFASTERDFKRARALGGSRVDVAAHLAPIYLDTRRFQAVIDETPASAPTSAAAARLLAYRSRAYTGLGETGAAASALQQARKLAPGSDEVLLVDARTALTGNDLAAAETAVDGALKDNPANLEALLLKAQMRANAKDPAAALAIATRAVDAAPLLVAPHLARAKILLDGGELDKASADLARLEALGYRNVEATYLLAVIAVRKGQFVEAESRFDSISAALPAFPRATYYQALAALGRNLSSTAVEFASRYARLFPKDADGVRLLARAQLANGRPDLAVAALKQAIADGITDPETTALYSGALARVGDLAKAQDVLAAAPPTPRAAAQLSELETRRGNYADAVSRLERARAEAPGDVAVLEGLVQAQIAKGDVDAAAGTLEALKAKAGPSEVVGIFTGMLAMARLDVGGAIDAFTATAQAFPASVVATVDLARALAANGQTGEARSRLVAALGKTPTEPLLLAELVQLETAAGRPEAALGVLEAARKTAPTDETLALVTSDLLMQTGDGRAAVAVLTGLRTAPRPARLAALARAYKATGQKEEEAATYKAIIASDAGPEWSVPASLSLADFEYRDGKPDAARQVLDNGIARTPANLALLSSRVQFEVVRSGLEAGRAMAAKLRSDPAQMPAAATLAGDLAMRMGLTKDAIAAFKAETPRTPALTVRIAEALAMSGDDKGAAAELATVPGAEGAVPILAQIAVRAKRWPEAVGQLERASRLRPNDAVVLNNLAWAYQQVNDPRALPAARRAYLIDSNPDIADTLGWILAEQNAAPAAVAILRSAAAQSPQNPTILYHLAVALARTGNAGDASETVQRALRTAVFDDRAAAQALASSLQAGRN